ncbi:MAG TPA: hypothetical protein VHU88_06930 [Sporichthyaceae bacterium]|jgi:hypothetical protein|nr:hypothetical protein [Sporichthyaceae bacterium]
MTASAWRFATSLAIGVLVGMGYGGLRMRSQRRLRSPWWGGPECSWANN